LKIVKPPRLRPGHTIGVCSPSSYADPFSLKAGIDFLTKQGYKVRLGEATRKMLKTGFMAAPDKDRAEEIMALFKEPEVNAIFCSVGDTEPRGFSHCSTTMRSRIIPRF